MVHKVTSVWNALGDDGRKLVVQLVRYGIVGGGITLFQVAIYNLELGAGHMPPLAANTAATLAAMLIGYFIHSRFTFEGHGSRSNLRRIRIRFFAANTAGFAVNSFWVWLFSSVLRLSPHLASLPVFFVTPILLFLLNRKWVFE